MKCSNAFLFLSATVLWGGPIAPSAEASPANTPAPATARALLKAFAQVKGLEAQFTETKKNALLMAPLVNHGRLFFARPRFLARFVDRPRKSQVVISATALKVTENGKTQTIDLSGRPEARLLVSSLVDVLAGDHQGLESAYTLKYEVQGRAWTLELRPKSKTLARLIARLQFKGQGLAVQEVTVEETSKDVSVTKITHANPKRTFTPKEHRRLFGAAPK